MIILNLAMNQDKAIELLEAYEGDFNYNFKEKKGIKLYFDVDGDPEAAAPAAKALIKAEPWGSSLYFSVEAAK